MDGHMQRRHTGTSSRWGDVPRSECEPGSDDQQCSEKARWHLNHSETM